MKLFSILTLSASALLLSGLTASSVKAHGGGLNSEGCHNDRKNGGYHCHRGSSAGQSKTSKWQAALSSGSSTYFANCSAARAAGAAPVRAGDPGYSARLDRDGDGVGCE